MNLYGVLLLLVLNVGHVTSYDCPSGWVVYDTSCYLFPRNHLSTFTEAEHYCRQHQNSHLVEINSAAENNFVRDFLRGLKAEYRWFGLTDETAEGTWVWYSNNAAPEFTDWGPSEPDSCCGDQDCGTLDPRIDYQWNDGVCTMKAEPICELGGESVVVGK